MKTLDVILLYYDKPEMLTHWFYRLVWRSDFEKFADRIRIIIADSGTPLNKLDASLKVVNAQPQRVKNRITYFRAETDDIRAKVPSDIDARPVNHTRNIALFEISEADVIMTSVIGHLFSPRYFNGHIAEHIKDQKAVVLPKRFDLVSEDFHESEKWKSDWPEILSMTRSHSGGWPDVSVRRKWLKEIGGWDESYITIAPDDMDLGSRLTGKLDNGQPSEALFEGKGPFDNLGLNFIQPYRDDFFSLTCNTYRGHIAKEDSRRQKGYELGIKYYLENWSKIHRNEGRVSVKYEILDFGGVKWQSR